jgi:tetratricopeptide (TPR) repeat protein
MPIEIPPVLIEDISKGRGTLFLGAGASREADFPDSNTLAEYLASKAGNSYSSKLRGQALDTVADYLYMEQGYGKQWVRQKIIGCFEKKHRVVKRPPSQAHGIMTKIKWRTIFTTNYDRLIEIAYELSPDCVQRVLPIYTPDAQIRRHEEEVARLIKLNGSVDEAARNSSHELVLTFADQQEARSRNSEFYELLREEVINGPIIFVGFSFTHPGARNKGTSPEFSLLQEILREMGPASRWHYCVTPFDPSSPDSELILRRLHANQIKVINATFGEFLDALFKELQVPRTPLAKRPSIVIPIAHTSIRIDADEYAKDRRHFEIIGSHLEELTPPSVTESLNGYETWASFLNGHFIERFCKKDFLSKLKDCIHNAPQIIPFVASPGWGKTFLLRDAAVEFYRESRPVIWLNPYGTVEIERDEGTPIIVGMWDVARIDRIVGMIADEAKEKSLSKEEAVPIIIADNCPERVEEAFSLFWYLTNNNRSFILVFAVRDNEFDSIIQEYPLLKKVDEFRPEGSYNTKEEVRALIDFCTQHKVAIIEDSTQREVVAQSIISEEADTAIILALQVIFDRNHRPFSKIVKEFWEGLHEEVAQKLVLRVASLHRFGSAFFPRLYTLLRTFPYYTHLQVLDVYHDLRDKRILFESSYDEEPCVYTLHSLVAEHITKVCGKTPAQIDDELILMVQQMGDRHDRDLEIVRRLLKQINEFNINLSSEDKINELFKVAADATNDDWVVCDQFSKYLLRRSEYESAFALADRALEKNPTHPTLQHHKGYVLSRWGMSLKMDGNFSDAEDKFKEARKYFALSRVRAASNIEYGYVSHLDMLLFLINKAKGEVEETNLIAEGTQLYREGGREVPEDQLNIFLDDRFRFFDLDGRAVEDLCLRIGKAIAEGKSSVYATTFLAQQLYKEGKYISAVKVLKKQREVSDEGILAWVKEAELHAREGNLFEAAKCIDSAKRRELYAENAETLWSLLYWDLVIAIALEDFREARSAIKRLSESKFFPRHDFPRGYIWKKSAREVPSQNRSFKQHAKIWGGRVQAARAGGRYASIRISNLAGDIFNIGFNQKYFSRKDVRPGDYVEFVITFLPNGIRADDPETKPFVNTVDDIFV